MESIKLWARNGEAVRQGIELGELVHMETASEELTDAFLLFALESGLSKTWADAFPDPRAEPEIGMEVLWPAHMAARFAGLYSMRKASMASSWAARRAGRNAAIRPTIASRHGTTTKVSGSRGPMPNKRLFSRSVKASAPAIPMTRPTQVSAERVMFRRSARKAVWNVRIIAVIRIAPPHFPPAPAPMPLRQMRR